MSMATKASNNGPENIMEDVFSGLEQWCSTFNEFFNIYFIYLKYILVAMLILIGMMTLLRLRGVYFIERTKLEKNTAKDELPLRRLRIWLGCFYIAFAVGIIFNFAIYLLIVILDPLPDRYIFLFLDFSGNLDPESLNRIQDLQAAKYPHEQTIYYCVALASFGAILDFIFSFHYIINNAKANHRTTFALLMSGLTIGILAGFTTCLPLFL